MTTCIHHPASIRFTTADFFRALRQEATRGPRYVQLGARRLLNRILGPSPCNWAPRPPQLPELPLTPAQRRWFHLDPVPLPTDLLLLEQEALEQEDTLDEEDDPL